MENQALSDTKALGLKVQVWRIGGVLLNEVWLEVG